MNDLLQDIEQLEGYVNKLNLVGKAQLVFFSNDTLKSSFLKFWNWDKSLRTNRILKKL